MRTIVRILTISALLVPVAAAPANASDAVVASIAPVGQPVPAVVAENGTQLSQGTYAIGTIHLLYIVEAYEFPTGDFAVFNLGLRIQASTNKPFTDYPVNALTLEQTGSSNVILTPQPASFVVDSSAWGTVTPVTISIPVGVPNDDGTTLVGNLQLVSPGGSHLDTVTTVKVRIKLVHPTACIKLFNFITDTTLSEIVTSTQVNVNTRQQKITSTSPYGQLSSNVLAVNTCPTAESFDARVLLDGYFSTSPSNNPGNAVFTFFSSSEVDPASFEPAVFGAGTPQGQALCLQNVTLPAHSSWLATVKMGINNGSSSSSLGSGGTFNFSAALFAAGSSCTGAFGLAVTPENPASAPLPYTVK
jgi:hypothetical protein